MKFYTIKEVSALLGVTEQTIRNLLWKDSLKGVRVGNAWRIREVDLNKYLGIDD